jgi:hypothetical protein
MSRGNQILTAILVVQLVLIVFSFWSRSVENVDSEPLLGEIDIERVSRITVHDLTEGQLQLSKVSGTWVLPNADDFPCEADVVSNLLNRLATLQGDRIVTETKASHQRLQVAEDNYVRLVEFMEEDGTTYGLYIGSSPSYGSIHVRVRGQDPVYLVSGLSSAEVSVQAANWIDTGYLMLRQDQVIYMSLENGYGQYDFARSSAQDDWTMAGLAADETLEQSAVTSLLNQVSSVRMVRPLGRQRQQEYGLDDPSAVLVIHMRDENGELSEYELYVGAQGKEDGTFVVKSSESPYYVEIAAYIAEGWLARTKEDFLELPPTPTAEALGYQVAQSS